MKKIFLILFFCVGVANPVYADNDSCNLKLGGTLEREYNNVDSYVNSSGKTLSDYITYNNSLLDKNFSYMEKDDDGIIAETGVSFKEIAYLLLWSSKVAEEPRKTVFIGLKNNANNGEEGVTLNKTILEVYNALSDSYYNTYCPD